MNISYRKAQPEDAHECLVLRSKTRQNAFSIAQLEAIGVTHESWKQGIESGELPGYVCLDDDTIVGYCFGEKQTGEIVVLATLPNYENLGIGKELLARVVCDFKKLGHKSLFLGCSDDPNSRSYGFYRHLGWRSTGKRDSHQDEILELLLS
ncbi:MAG: GNAT family N-acetyltransferase [Halieaceae bacterium]